MNSPSPQIGFDRFIQLDWAAIALRIRVGVATIEDLMEDLDSSHAGPAAKKKTRTVLNRLWLEPRPDLVDFADRGVRIYRDAPDTTAPALTWGMALAAYPFFGRVSEIVGRLTALQGDCTSAEVHRRMTELYGEREGTRRMTNMVLQSQASWGAIERLDGRKRIVRTSPRNPVGTRLAIWLIESGLRFSGRDTPLAGIQSSPALYPFDLSAASTYSLAQSKVVELRVDSAGSQILSLDTNQLLQRP